MYLPLHIDLRGKKVLIIGFGKVGRRRAEKLLAAGARVTAIDKRNLKAKWGVMLLQKNLRPNNLPSFTGYSLIVVATDDRKLNAAIVKKAKREGCLVNRADYFGGGDVIFPAVARVGDLTISFTTLGKSPRLAKLAKGAFEHGVSKD